MAKAWEIKGGFCLCNGGRNQSCSGMTNSSDCRRCCADVSGGTFRHTGVGGVTQANRPSLVPVIRSHNMQRFQNINRINRNIYNI